MKMLRKILVKIFPSLRRKTAEAKTTQTDCSSLELFFFLDEIILQKKEAIRQLELDLECPICLEIVEGEIYSCVFQHFICSECRCPWCWWSVPSVENPTFPTSSDTDTSRRVSFNWRASERNLRGFKRSWSSTIIDSNLVHTYV